MGVRGAQRARWRQVPAGMRDETAVEVSRRRRLEATLLEVFARWGYAEVATPTLEFQETFLHGAGPGVGDRLLKMVDSGGEVLALRPEMTVPLARLAATRLLPTAGGPLRLAYAGRVFRAQERGSGRLREFTQAGVELVGEAGPDADAEVVALAAQSLQAAGVPAPALGVGHAGFLRGLLGTLPEPAAEAVRDLLYRKAFADLDGILAPGPALEALRLLPALRGPSALDRARALATSDESREALEALRLVIERLGAHALAAQVEVDLGLIRDFEYYTGIVFEAHARGLGLPLLGGGRYDGLLARFGQAAPATGFAVGLERVLEVADDGQHLRPLVGVEYSPGAYGQAVAVAADLRGAGWAVVVEPLVEGDGRAGVACRVTVTPDGLLVCTGRQARAALPGAVVETVRALLEVDGWRS